VDVYTTGEVYWIAGGAQVSRRYSAILNVRGKTDEKELQ
jgi:ribosomal protein S16